MKKGKGNTGTGSNKPPSSKTTKPKRPSPNPHGRSQDEAVIRERRNRLHRELKSGSYRTRKSLAELLEVHERTVIRDMRHLERQGMPLEFCKKKGGFYYTHDVPDVPNQPISPKEIGAIATASYLANQLPGHGLKQAIQSLSRKVQSGLPPELRKRRSEIGKYISIRFTAESVIDPAVLDLLYKVTLEHKQIRLEYRRPGEREFKPRVMDPLHLAGVNGEWFLFAYDHRWKKNLCFAPIRMRNIEETGVIFERPEFDIDKELEQSFGIYSAEGVYNVVLRSNRFVAHLVREKRWRGETKKVELPCGGIEWHLTLSSLNEIERFIATHSGNTVVLAPPELQQRVLASAKQWVCEQEKACAETAKGDEGLAREAR
ncbi:MAG: helix-turn-helix transcriptional regulator [Limisphaerales bacterium]